jgi:hypothetical protein
MMPSTKFARAARAHDQIGRRDRCPLCRRILQDNRLAMVEMAGERRRGIAAYAADPGADIGEKTPTNGGGQPAADLNDLKPCQ